MKKIRNLAIAAIITLLTVCITGFFALRETPNDAVAVPIAGSTLPAPGTPILPTMRNMLPRSPSSIKPSHVMLKGLPIAPELEFYGNFNTAGVILQMARGFRNMGTLQCYLGIDGDWVRQQDLVQSGSTENYMTSIFYLEPNSKYEVKVVLTDGEGHELKTYYTSGSTRREPAMPRGTYTLHVDPKGLDANRGTREEPVRTITQALTMAGPGTHIVLREGVYFEGELQPSFSGQARAPIVIRSLSGEYPVIDGADPELMDPKVWEQAENGTYVHFYEGKCYNVTLLDKKTGERIRLLPLKDITQLHNRKVPNEEDKPRGTFEELGITGAFACDGRSVWLLPPKPLENYQVNIAKHTKGFILENKKHIIFDGLEIRHFGKNDYSTAAIVNSSSDITFQNCRFLFNDTYVWIKGNSDRVTVQDCYFKDGVIDFPFSLLKTGGAVASFEAGAINVDAKFSGRGLVVRRNHIENLFDGVHLTPWRVDAARSNEIDFYHNVVIDCVDDFIEADGYSRNVRIFENYMRRSLTGVSLAQALDGPTYVIYNVIADCGLVPATTREGNWSYPFKTNGGKGAGNPGSGPIFFYHNTAFTTDPKSHAGVIKRPTWKKITFRNNIWAGQAGGFEIWKNPPSEMDWDFDNLWVADTNAPLFLMAYKIPYAGLKEVREATTWLEHGHNGDPKVVDAVNGDYRLQSDSICVDAGTHIPGINDERSIGDRWDIGCYEQ